MTPLARLSVLMAATALLAAHAAAPLAPIAAPAALRIPAAVRARIAASRLIDLPVALRHRNWQAPNGQGSCVHASLLNLFAWQGRHDLVAQWRNSYGGGETADGAEQKLAARGLKFAETRCADESFLDWACRTRRGAAVVVQNGSHMVDLLGLTRTEAVILDSNFPDRERRMPRSAFISDWRASGGWALTPLVGPPSPPAPWIIKEVP